MSVKKNFGRLLAMVLCMMVAFAALPMTAFAADGDPVEITGEYTVVQGTSMLIPAGTMIIRSGGSITVESGANLTIPAGSTLIVEGTLISNGTIINNGTLTNSGTVTNNGDITNSAGSSYTGTAPSGSGGVTYAVTLNTNGGADGTPLESYTVGAGATLPTNYTNANHNFAGWYDNEQLSGNAVSEISTSDYGNKTYWAKWTPYSNTIDVSNTTVATGTNWTYADGVFTVTGDVTITGSTKANRVVVQNGATANITLNGVDIDVSGTDYACAFDTNGATVTLTLAADSENILKSGYNKAGINVPSNAELTIDGEGSLEVTGGGAGAGIGSGFESSLGKITVAGGDITATGGAGGAGIGTGLTGSSGGTITITGGTVTATNGNGAAGIGGGHSSGGGTITITGGTVNIISTFTGIGSTVGTAWNITIDGGTVTASTSSTNPNFSAIGGNVSATININGGTVTAIGGGTSSIYGKLTMNGNAVVVASGISDAATKTKGILFNGNTGTVYDTAVTPTDDWEVPAGATLTIGSGQTVTNNETLTNNGTIEIADGGALINNGTIINNGIITNSGAVTNDGGITNDGTVTNTSTGTVEIGNSSTLTNNDTVTNDGVITNDGTLTNSDGGTVEITSGGTLTNNGTVDNDGGITNDGTVTNTSTGTVEITSDGTLTNNGTVTNDGEITNGGTVTNTATGTVEITSGGTLTNSGTVENNGTLDNEGGITNSAGSSYTGAAPTGSGTSTYTVTLNATGGTGGTVLTSYTYGTSVTLPRNYTKANYTFAGWYDNAQLSGSEVTAITSTDTGNKEYWAKWTPGSYTITYELNGGTQQAGTWGGYSYGTGLTLPTPTRTGYTFGGWYANADLVTGGVVSALSATDTGNRAYWAKWTAITVTGVTLNETTLALDVGGSETLIAAVVPANAANTGVAWTSSDTAVATVDASGKVTAVASGTTTITVTTSDGSFTATCAVTVLETYGVLDAPSTWNGSGDAVARIDAPYSEFIRLTLDGNEVSESNYTVADGSTIITLKESYIKTLGVGTHNFRAEFGTTGVVEGYANFSLTIAAASTPTPAPETPATTTPSSPQTGDSTNMTLWITLLVLSVAALAVGIVIWRRQRSKETQ